MRKADRECGEGLLHAKICSHVRDMAKYEK